jgi:hypothetical protein
MAYVRTPNLTLTVARDLRTSEEVTWGLASTVASEADDLSKIEGGLRGSAQRLRECL